MIASWLKSAQRETLKKIKKKIKSFKQDDPNVKINYKQAIRYVQITPNAQIISWWLTAKWLKFQNIKSHLSNFKLYGFPPHANATTVLPVAA